MSKVFKIKRFLASKGIGNPLLDLLITDNEAKKMFPDQFKKEKLSFREKTYSGFAIVSSSGFALRSRDGGEMAIFWDKNLAEDYRKIGEKVVKCDIKIWKKIKPLKTY